MTKTLEQYVDALLAKGMPNREIARAYCYAERYGLDALSGEGCATFARPSCGDWDCVRPDHQVLRWEKQ